MASAIDMNHIQKAFMVFLLFTHKHIINKLERPVNVLIFALCKQLTIYCCTLQNVF